MRGLAATLADWLDAVGLVRPSLVANSFGCQIAVELAVARPERVAALVLVGPTVDMYARSLPRQFARLVLDSVREPPGLLALIVLDYSIFVLRRGAPLVRAMLSDRLEENLPHVLQPTLVVRGSRDAIVSQPWAEKASALLPHGEMCVVDGAAHAVNYADPDALARVVCAFLGRAREP